MARDFNETLREQLKNPEFRAEWDALEPEYQLVKAMLDGREKAGLTQRQLSERTGITQADISRLECGEGNPSLQTLKRLASGLDRRLVISFV